MHSKFQSKATIQKRISFEELAVLYLDVRHVRCDVTSVSFSLVLPSYRTLTIENEIRRRRRIKKETEPKARGERFILSAETKHIRT